MYSLGRAHGARIAVGLHAVDVINPDPGCAHDAARTHSKLFAIGIDPRAIDATIRVVRESNNLCVIQHGCTFITGRLENFECQASIVGLGVVIDVCRCELFCRHSGEVL